MKEIVSGLDHHWSSSAPLLMREYLHAAANNLVGFIKMDVVDKGSPAFRAHQLRESGMNWLEKASYGFLRCREHHLEKRYRSLLFFKRFLINRIVERGLCRRASLMRAFASVTAFV